MKDIKSRTKEFAVNCWKFCSKIPHSREYNAYVNQLLRSSSSVGANYRAAQRAKSTADFINKLKIVEEEADESMYFLELFIEILDKDIQEVKLLHSEANEIVSIVVASINTAKRNQQER
ncbi:four helix bundle protein [Salinimicrobium sp. TH3]|uniref:four helix bundle protein n=1 Tax=Salinimicrobium sp. TH3 TaxID=2997342 RepID=UPI00227429FD|nr:four helix bundle protein [Salinimicrobium sp. TH3]MCY2687229.1 four helix bundle protein [Salinimicrobium sp. TH3]